MKAIFCTQYGSPDVLRLKEVEKPAPKDDEVLVRIHAASANPLDWHLMRGSPFLARLGGGLRRPKDPRLGVDIAGRVEAVGNNLTQFRPGNEVFGTVKGGFAEYACAREDRLALKPGNISFEEAAAAPVVAFTALQGLRDKGKIMARLVVWVRLRCRLPSRSRPKSLACAARGIWIWCAPLAQTTSLITREKISPRTGSDMT